MRHESIRLAANATLPSVRLLAAAARGVLAIWPLSEERRALLELALVEASTNVVRHAYAGRAGGPIELGMVREGEKYLLSVTDHGRSFDPALVPPPPEPDPDNPNTWPEGGLGLPIIRAICDTLHYVTHDGANTLTLTLRVAEDVA